MAPVLALHTPVARGRRAAKTYGIVAAATGGAHTIHWADGTASATAGLLTTADCLFRDYYSDKKFREKHASGIAALVAQLGAPGSGAVPGGTTASAPRAPARSSAPASSGRAEVHATVRGPGGAEADERAGCGASGTADALCAGVGGQAPGPVAGAAVMPASPAASDVSEPGTPTPQTAEEARAANMRRNQAKADELGLGSVAPTSGDLARDRAAAQAVARAADDDDYDADADGGGSDSDDGMDVEPRGYSLRARTSQGPQGLAEPDATARTVTLADGTELELRDPERYDDAQCYKEIFEAKQYDKGAYEVAGGRERFDFGVEEGDIVLDLGANVGIYALYALQEGASKVICVEPCPANLERLRVNLAAYLGDGRAEIVEAAVTLEGSGAVSMQENGYRTRITEARGGFEAATVAMQALLRDHRVTFCKMDIEGAELDILASTELDWADCRRLTFEYTIPANQRRAGRADVVQIGRIQQALHSLGWSTKSWQPSLFAEYESAGRAIDKVLHCVRNPLTSTVLRELRRADALIRGEGRDGEAYEGCDSLDFGLSSRSLTQVEGKERGIAATQGTLDNPYLANMLCNYVRAVVDDEAFLFSSILVTKDSEYGLHVDSKNVGRSVIITLGNHSGGELWSASATIDGKPVPGGPISAHNEPHFFDGNVPHCTLPFVGDRFSVIAYLTQVADSDKFADEDRAVYDGFNFRIPPKGESAPRPEYEPADKGERLQKGEAEYAAFKQAWNKAPRAARHKSRRGGKASAGFFEISRGQHRRDGGAVYNGELGVEQRTCLIDAAAVCMADQGADVDIATCREYTAEEGDTSIPQAREMTREADFDIVSHPGGQFSSNELAVVNIRSGHHIVLLKITHQNGAVDQHAMALTQRGGEMHLVDNRRLKPVAMLSDDDRVDQWSARGVFYNLLRDAAVDEWGQGETFRASVRSVWSVVPRSKRGAESQQEEPAGKRRK